MEKEKSPIEYSMKNWRNLGIYIMLIGLVMAFLGNDLNMGLKFFAVGFVFTLIFQGTKIFKILKEIWNYIHKK